MVDPRIDEFLRTREIVEIHSSRESREAVAEVSAAALVLCLMTVWKLVRLFSRTRGLTLRTAFWWSFCAQWVLTLSVAGRLFFPDSGAAWHSAASYLSATLLLTPLIVILGARRPGIDAWRWFVVLPLTVVLQWPAAAQLLHGVRREPLEIGTPAIIGVLLILVMGGGNYFGTGFTGPACLLSAGIVLQLLPVSGWISDPSSLPLWSPVLIFIAVQLTESRLHWQVHEIQNTSDRTARVDRVWSLFRDLYGIVWAKRVMDRVNVFARRENWARELTLDGFVPPQSESHSASTGMASAGPVTEAELTREIDVMCWVMRRFADSVWLQQLFGETPRAISESHSDS